MVPMHYDVNPAVLEIGLDGSLRDMMKPPDDTPPGLYPEEACVVALIRKKSATLIESLPMRAA
jgi:hypothetical protein